MKIKIFKLLLLTFIIGFVASCSVDDNVENLVPAQEADLGSLITIEGEGKILGSPYNPDDLENSEVAIQEFVLNIDVAGYFSEIPDDVAQYEVFKQYNGGEKVSLATFEDLSHTVSASSLDELLSGLGITESDLRIGDVFRFTVELTTQSGNVLQALPSYSVTVNCLSNLAGTYSVATTNLTAGATADMGTEEIVEVSPGYYKTVTTGTWEAGSIAPDQGYNFEDICGTITVPSQGLAQGYYSNEVFGTEAGSVDGSTGVITVYYTITFSSGNNEYKSVYTPQ